MFKESLIRKHNIACIVVISQPSLELFLIEKKQKEGMKVRRSKPSGWAKSNTFVLANNSKVLDSVGGLIYQLGTLKKNNLLRFIMFMSHHSASCPI